MSTSNNNNQQRNPNRRRRRNNTNSNNNNNYKQSGYRDSNRQRRRPNQRDSQNTNNNGGNNNQQQRNRQQRKGSYGNNNNNNNTSRGKSWAERRGGGQNNNNGNRQSQRTKQRGPDNQTNNNSYNRQSRVLKQIEKDSQLASPPRFKPLNARQLHQYYKTKRYLKLVEAKTPISRYVKTIDVSIKDRNKEDETYLYDQELQERLRRGNTLIKVVNQNYSIRDLKIGRRGLPKFYDLRAIHLKVLNGEKSMSTFDSKNYRNRLSYYEWRTIIPELEHCLDKNGQISVYMSEKANGENAQVSFVGGFEGPDGAWIDGFWVVCSKNVGLAFRDLDDVEHHFYDSRRFSYARQISKVWLGSIAGIAGKQLANLEVFLQKNTFIGEYCGNKTLQHLVHYKKEEIIFYAVVPKYGSAPCLPFHESESIFKRYGLKSVKIHKKRAKIQKIEILEKTVDNLAHQVARSSVEEMGEGSVVYFEGYNASESPKTRILSICKLKTLDYRYWRKLREKLKNYLLGKLSRKKLLDRFKSECLDLARQGGFKMCYDLNYYIDISEKATEVIEDCFITGEHLRTVYLDFLGLVKKCYDEGDREPTWQERVYFRDKDLNMDRSEDEEDWNGPGGARNGRNGVGGYDDVEEDFGEEEEESGPDDDNRKRLGRLRGIFGVFNDF